MTLYDSVWIERVVPLALHGQPPTLRIWHDIELHVLAVPQNLNEGTPAFLSNLSKNLDISHCLLYLTMT